MLNNLRNADSELLSQLASLTEHLVDGSHQLTLLLSQAEGTPIGPDSVPPHPDFADRTHDVHAFEGYSRRLDRMEFRTLAVSLDSSIEAVREATVHVRSLRATDAPAALRNLSALLAKATDAIHASVPSVGQKGHPADETSVRVAQYAEEGDAIYYAGVGALFAGTPDPLDALRWKDVYDKVNHALASCAATASVLAHLAP